MPNLADLSTATKVLLGAGVLMFIDLFLAWQKIDNPLGQDFTASGWDGLGILVGLLVIALIAWEAIQLTDTLRKQNVNLPVAASLISAALAAAVLLFTFIKFVSDNEFRNWPAWVGLILGIVIGIGGFLKWQEGQTAAPARATEPPSAPPPPPPPPGEPPPPPPA